jgi:hypothetical protein
VEVPPWHRAILNFIEVGGLRNVMEENVSLVFQTEHFAPERRTSGNLKKEKFLLHIFS